MRFSIIKSLFLLLWAHMAISQQRPTECWVRRSVLDKRARIVTLALDKDLYAAYDGNNCGIYKIWKGGIDYKGTIWNTVHGPQPVSKGVSYSEGILDEQIWFIQKNGKDVPTKVQFKGYSWENNKVTFRYELKPDSQTVFVVEETPEVLKKDGQSIGFERRFVVKNITAPFTVGVNLKYSNLLKKEDLITDGNFKVLAETKNYGEALNTMTYFGRLYLKNNTTTTITANYSTKVIQ